jgi:hypothetical protein
MIYIEDCRCSFPDIRTPFQPLRNASNMKSIFLLLIFPLLIYAATDSAVATLEQYPDSVVWRLTNAGDTTFLWAQDIAIDEYDTLDTTWYPIYIGPDCTCRKKCRPETLFFPKGKTYHFVWRKNRRSDCTKALPGKYRYVLRTTVNGVTKIILAQEFTIE